MPLKTVVEKIEDVDEPLRTLYVEKNGKFTLDVEGLEDVDALKRNLDIARNTERTVKKKIEAWEKLGKTPEEIAELLAAADKKKDDDLNKDGDIEKIKQGMAEKHDKEVKRLQGLIEKGEATTASLKNMLERSILDQQAMQAITAEKGEPLLLMPIVQRMTKMVEDNGKTKVQVVDDKGEARFNGKGDPMTVAELVAEMRASEVYGRAFEGTGAAGSGSQGGGPGNGAAFSGITKRSDFAKGLENHPSKRIEEEKRRSAFVTKYGLQAYENLPL